MNGIFSSPAVRMHSSRSSGCLVGEPWWATRSGLTDSSISPCEAVTSRRRARSSRLEDAEVGVRQQAALERALADPDDVGGEVGVPERGELRGDPGVVVGRLAGEHQQLLDVALDGAVEDLLDLRRLVQVRLVRRERAVLAVAPARPGQRQRQVAREGDPAAHPAPSYAAPVRPAPPRSRCSRARRLRRHHRRGPPERDGDAAARLHAQRRARGDLRRLRARLRRRRGRQARDPQAERLDRRAEAAAGRPRRHGDPRHPRSRDRAREGPRPRRRDGARPAPARRGARPAGHPHARRTSRASAPASPGCRRTGRPALGRRGRGRRPGPRARDDDRLRGGQGAARPPRRGGDRVLERRGRRRCASSGPASASSASTTTARPPTRSSSSPSRARRSRTSRRSCARRSARSSAATRRPRTTRRARSRRCSSASRASTAPRSRPSSTPSPRRSPPGAAEFGAAAAGAAARVGRVGRALRDPEGADRRDARLRHDARQAPAGSLTPLDRRRAGPSSWMYWAMSAAVRRSSDGRTMTGRGCDVFHPGSFGLYDDRRTVAKYDARRRHGNCAGVGNG